MHRHRILVHILLTLSILNSVLAAPAVSVREIHEARGVMVRSAMAARVPAEGGVAVLQKRPYEEPSSQPVPQTGTSGLSPEHPPEEIYHDALPNPPENHDALPNPAESHGALPNPPESHGALPNPPENHDTSPNPPEPEQPPKQPSKWQWKEVYEKTMTPEKIKALKYVGLAGLVTTAYLGLLIPTITKNDGPATSPPDSPPNSQS